MVCLISSEADENQNSNPAKGEKENYTYLKHVKAPFYLALQRPFKRSFSPSFATEQFGGKSSLGSVRIWEENIRKFITAMHCEKLQ